MLERTIASTTTGRFVAAAFAPVFLVPLGLDSGGFFPTAWGWASLALLAAAALAILLRGNSGLGVADALWLSLFGLFAAMVLGSSLWSVDPTQSVLAGERAGVYPLGLAAVMLVVRREETGRLLGGLVVTSTLISVVALGLRFLPSLLGSAGDPIAGGQLYAPIGYWNGLGCMMAVGLALTAGLWLDRDRSDRRWLLAACAPQIVALALTQSRGATGGLIVGAMTCVALRRRSGARRRPSKAALAVMVLVVAVALGSGAGGLGGSNASALSLTGRGTLWSISADQFEAHPVLGAGAGTWEAYWSRLRPHGRDVGNPTSLYVQAFGELGLVGTALLLGALLLPLAAAVRLARPGDAVVPAAAGAYAALLVDAAVDWDWELPAVFLFGLFCGAVVLIAVRRDRVYPPPPMAPAARAGALAGCAVLACLAAVGLVGNSLLSASSDALAGGNTRAALRDARRAGPWMPWSYLPAAWQGEVELADHDPTAAAVAFRSALAKPRAPGVWQLWWDLARASSGVEQVAALHRAIDLNPLSPEIRAFCAQLLPRVTGPVAGVCRHLPRHHHHHGHPVP